MRSLSRLRLLALVLCLPLLTTGCFSVEMLVKVQPDGSGEVHVETLVQKAFVEQLQMMVSGLSGAEPGESSSLFSESSLKELAGKMGDGLELVSRELIETDEAEGVRGVFSFTDINQIEPDLGSAAPGGASLGTTGDKTGLSFQLEKGKKGRSTLVVAFPEQAVEGKDSEDGEGGEEQAFDPSQLAMMSGMLKGMRVSFAVEVGGKVLDSNVPHEGSRVPLLLMDFDQMMADPETLEKLMGSKLGSFSDIQGLAGQVPGLEMPAQREVRVEFRGK